MISQITRATLFGLALGVVALAAGCGAEVGDDESNDSEADLLTARAAKTGRFQARQHETRVAVVSLKRGDTVAVDITLDRAVAKSTIEIHAGAKTVFSSAGRPLATSVSARFHAPHDGRFEVVYQKDGTARHPVPAAIGGAYELTLRHRRIPAPPPAKSCRGYAEECSRLSAFDCDDAQGCRSEETCEGYASSCFGRSVYSCSSQQGCFATGYDENGMCTGSARSCDSIDGYACSSQEGCSSRRVCRGWVERCDGIDDSYDCERQPGCRWE